MAKVTFATKEQIEKTLNDFKSEIAYDLEQFYSRNENAHSEIRDIIKELRKTVDEDLDTRIDEIEDSFSGSLKEFSELVEGKLEELSKNILVENINYINELHPDIGNVKDALDHLLHIDTTAIFTTNTNLVNEIGTVLSGVVLSWTYNKLSIESQKVNDVVIAKSNRAYSYPSTISENKTFILTFNDGKAEDYRELTFEFVNNLYFGVSNDLTETGILSLNKILSDNMSMELDVNAGENEHIVLAIPSRLGTPVFTVGGLDGGFIKHDDINITNSSGYTELYSVWKSTRTGLGTTKVLVK